MMTSVFSKGFFRSALALAGLLIVSATAPAYAQDGLLMRNLFGKIGLLPEEKEPIEYRERPSLVVPKQTDKLRPPEEAPPQARANGQWPVDPDVKAREAERARRNQPVASYIRADPNEGGRVSLGEMAAGRSLRGQKMGELGVPFNDKDGVRLSVQEMTAADKRLNTPSYPPGTEPPRRFLTDPPTGLRIPSAAAPTGSKTRDGPAVDDFKIGDAWKRID